MFRNYLKIAFRNLMRDKVYSLITISSLTVGITCCLVIIFYVIQETNYDSYHEKADRIYRIGYESQEPSGSKFDAGTPIPLAPEIMNTIPEAEKVSRIYFDDRTLIRANHKEFFEQNIAFADSTFFEIFSHKFIQGNPFNALEIPNSVVLTQSMAKKYFNEQNPIGQTIEYDNYAQFTITGVIEDVPINSHYDFDCLVSYSTLSDNKIFSLGLDQWGAITNSYTYVLVKEGISQNAFESKLNGIVGDKVSKMSENKVVFFLQPLTDINLYSNLSNEIKPTNSPQTLLILSTLGLFILLIGSINYMNLATARSARRAKEVGVRKVMGAFRWQLIEQFFAESSILTIAAFFVSVGFVEIALPYFSKLIERPIEYSYIINWELMLGIIVFVVTVGIISGSYPAVYLSRFQPVKVLKSGSSGIKLEGGIPSLRKILVVAQFSLCVLLLFGTIVVYNQLAYLRNADMGFKKEYNVVIPIYDSNVLSNYKLIKSRLSQIPNVNSTSASFKPPVGDYGILTHLYPKGKGGGDHFLIAVYAVDYDFINHFGLELIAGRNFLEQYMSDEINSFVVNEEAVRKLGFTSVEEALGHKYLIGANGIEGTIIGVIRNFNSTSLRRAMQPVVMLYWPDLFNAFTININSQNIPQTLSSLEKVWKEFIPNFPFEYQFLDEYIHQLYNDEERVTGIISIFAMIALIIGCLGLFGLSAYSVEQKIKEIGIRKVLGASISSVVVMLTKEFSKLVIISNLIALPIAYYLMKKWLEDFAYKIDIGIWIFLVSGALALIVALLTVSYQAIKAAITNPVDTLRCE